MRVSFNKSQQNDEAVMARACFLDVSQFPIRETLFPVSGFCFKMQIILTLHDREF